MKLTGVEVPFQTLFKLEPNTVLAVISDDKGEIRMVKVDHDSITKDESLLRVTGGCFVRTGGKLVWVNPCPY
ncbi:MAG: hypothetical protein WAV07_10780 [Candidatus Contendobacter sp.]